MAGSYRRRPAETQMIGLSRAEARRLETRLAQRRTAIHNEAPGRRGESRRAGRISAT
jgi:hypothetical protein